MLKSLKKRSYRFVVVLLLLTTLLTFDVGRVTKVEAVATTAAIVGEVLLGLGVTYIAYQTLTGANVYVPGYEESDMYEYVRGLGSDFSKSSSGSRIFSDLYNHLIADNTYSVVDFTQDRLKDIYNDHKSISYMQLESSFDATDDPYYIAVDFDFPFDITIPEYKYYIGSSSYTLQGLTHYDGPMIIWGGSTSNPAGLYFGIPVTEYTVTDYRNVYTTLGTYRVQGYHDSTWSDLTTWKVGGYSDYHSRYFKPLYRNDEWAYQYGSSSDALDIGNSTYPVLADYPIYNQITGQYTDIIPATHGTQLTPQYPQNDDGNNKLPIVPYVELPSTQKWGFNWRDALTDLINGGSRLITYSWLADLINDFKNSLSGSGDDIDYNFFNQGDTYYVTYYSNTVNDIDNPVYNIDVSLQEDVIPVDLNTIQEYTNNQYLTLIKERAETFGETFGELVAFWHNCDPEIVYAFLGASIIVLLGAFIGKWGHS